MRNPLEYGETMAEEELRLKIKDRVAYFTINREAKRNSISTDIITLFLKYLDEVEANENVRVISITGAGEKAFCSGADLGGAMTSPASGDGFKNYANLIKKLTHFPKPTVARVNGDCLAGGTGLMLACDIVIAVEGVKFGTPEVNIGLFPMMIWALIIRNVPKKKAMKMALLGDRLTAEQALDMGMVSDIVPAIKLDQEVNTVLTALASKSPIGIKIGKEALSNTADMPFEEAIDYLSEQLKVIAATEDAKEGIAAFIEKREPHFTGK
jgi:enoyl-CoA hydratase/carnithine racemase